MLVMYNLRRQLVLALVISQIKKNPWIIIYLIFIASSWSEEYVM